MNAFLLGICFHIKTQFAGGSGITPNSDRVDIFDTATGLWSLAKLSSPRSNAAATTLGTKVFFAGGTDNHGLTATVDICDTSFGLPITAD